MSNFFEGYHNGGMKGHLLVANEKQLGFSATCTVSVGEIVTVAHGQAKTALVATGVPGSAGAVDKLVMRLRQETSMLVMLAV